MPTINEGGGGGPSTGSGGSTYQDWLDHGNVGTYADFLNAIRGPQGAPGQDGAPGAPGANGASAYELWIAAGNSGTVADYLASLKGAKGDKGDQGNVGPAGPMAGQEIASTSITGPTNPTAAATYVTQGQVVVPAGTSAHEVELINGLLFQATTGTLAIKSALRVDVAMFDELNNLVAYNSRTFLQDTDATSKTTQEVIPCKASLPAAAVIKTYTVQVRATQIPTGGSAVTVLTGGSFPSRNLVARYR